jgi:hypothetical protein
MDFLGAPHKGAQPTSLVAMSVDIFLCRRRRSIIIPGGSFPPLCPLPQIKPRRSSMPLRRTVCAVVTLAFVGVAALGQTAAPAPSPTPTISSKVDDVSKWTNKQWHAARAKWAKERQKWADCEKRSKELKLSGKQSWSFLAMCMTG